MEVTHSPKVRSEVIAGEDCINASLKRLQRLVDLLLRCRFD